eukprot:g1589.t1
MGGQHFDIVTVEDWPFIETRTCPDKDDPTCVLKPWRMGNPLRKRWGGEPREELNWGGWIIEVIDFLSKEANFTYTLQLPNIASGSGTYGAADQAVRGMSLEGAPEPTIMFAGAYVTTKRLNWTLITSPYSVAPLSLLVREPDEELQFWRFAQPFTPTLWGVIGLLVTWTSLLFVLLEGDDNDSVAFGGMAFDSKTHFLEAFGNSLYVFCGLFTGRKQLLPHSRLGKSLAVVYGLLVMFVMTTYMGSAAAVLVADSTIPFPKTVMEFLNPRHQVCVLADSAYANYLKNTVKYAYLTQVPKGSLLEMAKGLIDGDCNGVIERKMHVEYLQAAAKAGALHGSAAEANGKPLRVHDSLVDGPQELAVMINTAAHTAETAEALSMWITDNVANGAIRNLYDQKVLFRNSLDFTATKHTEVDQIKLGDMLGLFAMVFVVFGVVVFLKAATWLYLWLYPSDTADPMEAFLAKMVDTYGEHQPEWKLYVPESAEETKAHVDAIVARWGNAQHIRRSERESTSTVIASEAKIMKDLTKAVGQYLVLILGDRERARKFLANEQHEERAKWAEFTKLQSGWYQQQARARQTKRVVPSKETTSTEKGNGGKETGKDPRDARIGKDKIVEIFRSLDTNSSGELNFAELRTGFQRLGMDLSDDDVASMLLAFDDDNDGKLQIDEWTQMVTTLVGEGRPSSSAPGSWSGSNGPRRGSIAELVFSIQEKRSELQKILQLVIRRRQESGADQWLSEEALAEKMALKIQTRWRRRAYEKRTGNSAGLAPS